MTTATDHQLESTQPADMGLLLTLNSRMHCRTPMQKVDPEEFPVRLPVYVDGTAVVNTGIGASSEHVETYRCACGFTIDAPVLSGHALAS